jgi:predicted O-methyltransferase YrrM
MDLKVREDLYKLIKPNSMCLELGVARGDYSLSLLENSENINHLYSIDMWADHHDINEYKIVIGKLDKHKERNSIIKLKFDQALDIFPDAYFDFIYIDGYAHTGEEDGKTFNDWWKKLKSGGVFSGDDYDINKWPKVYNNVNSFCRQNNLKLHVIQNLIEDRYKASFITTCMDLSPSWYTFKH